MSDGDHGDEEPAFFDPMHGEWGSGTNETDEALLSRVAARRTRQPLAEVKPPPTNGHAERRTDALVAALEALPKARVRQGWSRACCPAHDDANPSLGWRTYPDGSLAVKCHYGCRTNAIVKALGFEPYDLFPNSEHDLYGYRMPGSGDLWWKERGPNRSFQTESGFKQSEALPYRSDFVGLTQSVLVVEGEKCADAAVVYGINAIGVPGSGWRASEAAVGLLAGKDVVLWPDDDDKGLACMTEYATLLVGVAESVRFVGWPWLETVLPEVRDIRGNKADKDTGELLKDGRDISNVIAHDPGLASLIVEDAPAFVPPVRNRRSISMLSMDIPPVVVPLLDHLHPEALTIPFGVGGVGKGNMAAYWACLGASEGKRSLIVDYEGHRSEWVSRIKSLAATQFAGQDIESYIDYLQPNSPDSGMKMGGFIGQVEDIGEESRDLGTNLVLLDRIGGGAALGLDIKDDATATAFGIAQQRLGLPLVALSHVPKDVSNHDFPFGSAYWQTTARATLQMTSKVIADGVTLLTMRCKKFSDSPLLGQSFGFRIRYEGGRLVEVRPTLTTAVAGAGAYVPESPMLRVLNAIAHASPMRVGRTYIGDVTGLADKTLRRQLEALLKDGSIDESEGLVGGQRGMLYGLKTGG